jgi:hypothetical protein
MPANTAAIFVGTPLRPQVRVSTANTARDGTGTLATVYTAGASGAMFRCVRVTPEAAIGSGDVVRLFVQVGGAGNNELVAEIPIPPANPAASAAGTPPPALPSVVFWLDPSDRTLALSLGAGDVVKASTDQGKTYSVALEHGGAY